MFACVCETEREMINSGGIIIVDIHLLKYSDFKMNFGLLGT